MTTLIRWLCCVLALGIPAAAADAAAAKAELERTKLLIEAGALPRAALEKAEREYEAIDLREKLNEFARKDEITPEEGLEMLKAAARLLGIARENLRQVQSRVDAGALPVKALQPVTEEVEAAQLQLNLVDTRIRVIRQRAEMASAEDRLEELEEEGLAFSVEGESGLWPDDVDTIISLYFDVFGTALPISADGDTPLHRSLGLDHTGRVDVAVHPDEAEGEFLMEILEGWGIPYIAFRSAVPGQATGPHIHIGRASPRVDTADAITLEDLELAAQELGLDLSTVEEPTDQR